MLARLSPSQLRCSVYLRQGKLCCLA